MGDCVRRSLLDVQSGEQGADTTSLTGCTIFVSADESLISPRKQIIRLGCILTSVDMTDINLTTNKVQIDYYMVRFNLKNDN